MDVMILLPNGQRHRERRVLDALSRGAQRWGQDRGGICSNTVRPREHKEALTLNNSHPVSRRLRTSQPSQALRHRAEKTW